MYEIQINNSQVYQVEKKQASVSASDEKEEQFLLDNQPIGWDCVLQPDGSFSILFENKCYRAELLDQNIAEKTMVFRINGQIYEARVKEPIDQLLQSMGLNHQVAHQVNEIKAPMPGLVVDIMVQPGQQISKGDPVLILEAMKMENVFKAPADAIVKEIKVKEKMAVEKGQVLVVLA